MSPPSFNRKSARQQAGHLCRMVYPFGHGIRAYCGARADTYDHVLPISVASALAADNVYDMRKYRAVLICVPGCRECNSLGSNSVYKSLSAKREGIAQRLERKYRSLLGAYDWSEDELQEYGHSLQSYLRNSEHKRQFVTARLAFAKHHGRNQ